MARDDELAAGDLEHGRAVRAARGSSRTGSPSSSRRETASQPPCLPGWSWPDAIGHRRPHPCKPRIGRHARAGPPDRCRAALAVPRRSACPNGLMRRMHRGAARPEIGLRPWRTSSTTWSSAPARQEACSPHGSARTLRAACCSSRPAPTCGRARAPWSLRSPNPFRAMVEPHLGVLTWPGLRARRAAGQEPAPYMRGRGLGGSTAINGQIMLHAVPEDFDDWRDLGLRRLGRRRRRRRPAQASTAGRSRLRPRFRTPSGARPAARCARPRWPSVTAGRRTPTRRTPAASRRSATPSRRLPRLGERRLPRAGPRPREPHDPVRRAGRPCALRGRPGRRGRRRHPDRRARFRGREIVLAAGVTATPGILMRSGVGPAADGRPDRRRARGRPPRRELAARSRRRRADRHPAPRGAPAEPRRARHVLLRALQLRPRRRRAATT